MSREQFEAWRGAFVNETGFPPTIYDAWQAALSAQPVAQAAPLFLLHCGKVDDEGKQFAWDTEPDSGDRVDDFCRLHPGKTVPLFAQPPAEPAAQPATDAEPVAWTLQSELEAAQTTCNAHLWFTNPRNSAWTALFTREQIAAHPPRAPLTEEHVTAVVRSVCGPNLAETSKAWRDLVVECRYWLEVAHGIGGK